MGKTLSPVCFDSGIDGGGPPLYKPAIPMGREAGRLP